MSVLQNGKEIFKIAHQAETGMPLLASLLYSTQQLKNCLFFNLFKTTMVIIWLNTSNLDHDSGIQQLPHPLHTLLESWERMFFKVGCLS